jgi:hypothetical protein
MKTFLKENFFKFMIGLSALMLSIAVLIYIVSINKSNTSSEDNIIGKPIRIGRIEVAQYDFPKAIKWDVAREVCQKLGEGWRIPTKSELNLIYKNKYKIGGFVKDNYWSSIEYSNNGQFDKSSKALIKNFYDGNEIACWKEYSRYVRAVRSF